MARVPPPWFEAAFGSLFVGIKKIASADEFWLAIDALGDRQSYYVLERYVPARLPRRFDRVEKEVVFSEVHGYTNRRLM